MGAPITFGGFNNVDFGVVLNAIIQQERAPLTALEAQRSSLQAQDTAFATFATRLGALETAATALSGDDGGSDVSASSSDPGAVGISAGSTSVTGRYEVVVSELARSQVLASGSTYDSADAVVATSGVLSLARASNPPIDIPVTAATTLEDLAEAINSHANSPVRASIVQVSPGQYRLVLTGRSTGTENGFTASFSTPFSGGEGLSFADTDADGVFGDSAADNVQIATDAALTVNQVPVTSSSNVLDQVIPGVTLTLLKKDPLNTISVDVAEDRSKTRERLESFATAYNNLVSFVNDQRTAAVAGRAGISRDPSVRNLREALRSSLQGVASSGTWSRLAEVGVGFDIGGKITIDKDALDSALDSSPADVQSLFADRFGQLKSVITSYTESGGLIADIRDRIDMQVGALSERLLTLESQLAIRRTALQQEFIAADRAMSQLNSQGSSLAQLGGQFRLF